MYGWRTQKSAGEHVLLEGGEAETLRGKHEHAIVIFLLAHHLVYLYSVNNLVIIHAWKLYIYIIIHKYMQGSKDSNDRLETTLVS